MSDRKLLEMAAKAAGIVHVDYSAVPEYDGKLGLEMLGNHEQHIGTWNPLTDDGDALRLAVKLELDLYGASLLYVWAEHGVCVHKPDKTSKGNDPYAATRRAIVRAAAAIGKEMP